MGRTEHREVTKATFEFVNRDGVPTILYVDRADKPGVAAVNLTADGKTIDFEYKSQLMPNDSKHWGYRGAEGDPPAIVTMPAGRPAQQLGKVGQAVTSVVALAILTPLIGIVWAWAAGVVRGLGGLW